MNNESGSTLNIGWDDLNDAAVDAQVDRMRQAQQVPLVREVGEPGQQETRWYRGHLVQMALAGLIGGLLAWALVELQGSLMSPEASAAFSNITFTMLVGLGVGIVIASWDGLVLRSWEKIWGNLKSTGPILLGTTLVGGFIAHLIYSNWIDSLWETAIEKAYLLDWSDAQFYDYIVGQSHLPRGVAWAVVGMAVGVGLGLASRQSQKILNGAIGGLIGGFAGGALFDFFTSGVAARAVGLVITGLAIGLAIGLVEVARRQHWLEILSGGMGGKQFILYSGTTTVGSAPQADVTLIKDPGIAPAHVRLLSSPNGLAAESIDPTVPALVNGAILTKQALRDGDILQLGTTMVRYRDKAEQRVVAGQIAG